MGCLDRKEITKTYQKGTERDYIQQHPSKFPTGSRRGGNGQGAARGRCYVEHKCLALLMSADMMGAMLESRPQELAAKGKESIKP